MANNELNYCLRYYIVSNLQLLDIDGNIKRHILAPWAKTQRIMNMYFQGTSFKLAERYTVSIAYISIFLICYAWVW